MKATRGIDSPKKSGDAGYDLHSKVTKRIPVGQTRSFPTAAVEIPEGYCGLVIGRSGWNQSGVMAVLGLIDSRYRGEIVVMLHNTTNASIEIGEGERIAQLVLVPFGSFPLEYVNSVDELSVTERGKTGFGSTNEPVVRDDLSYQRITYETWIALDIETELRREVSFWSPSALVNAFGAPKYLPYSDSDTLGEYIFVSKNDREVWTIYDRHRYEGDDIENSPEPFWSSEFFAALHIGGPRHGDVDAFLAWVAKQVNKAGKT